MTQLKKFTFIMHYDCDKLHFNLRQVRQCVGHYVGYGDYWETEAEIDVTPRGLYSDMSGSV